MLWLHPRDSALVILGWGLGIISIFEKFLRDSNVQTEQKTTNLKILSLYFPLRKWEVGLFLCVCVFVRVHACLVTRWWNSSNTHTSGKHSIVSVDQGAPSASSIAVPDQEASTAIFWDPYCATCLSSEWSMIRAQEVLLWVLKLFCWVIYYKFKLIKRSQRKLTGCNRLSLGGSTSSFAVLHVIVNKLFKKAIQQVVISFLNHK